MRTGRSGAEVARCESNPIIGTGLAVALVVMAAETALAQSPPEPPVLGKPGSPAVQQQRVDPKACAPGERINPNQRMGDHSEPSERLTEKLARTEGVLCPPPGIDPQIIEPPPGGGVIQVIPPPGTAGDDRTVRPK